MTKEQENLLIQLDELSVECIERDSTENRAKLVNKMEQCLTAGVPKEKVTHIVESIASLHKKEGE